MQHGWIFSAKKPVKPKALPAHTTTNSSSLVQEITGPQPEKQTQCGNKTEASCSNQG